MRRAAIAAAVLSVSTLSAQQSAPGIGSIKK
jgi:hypothetical protein